MAAVNFTRAPADRVRITISPRRRNYRAMSTASQTSACLHPICAQTPPPSSSPGFASLLFDRASSSWWDPKFDSEVLESQLRQTAFPHVRRRFRFALAYGSAVAAAWAVYAAFHLEGSLALGVGIAGCSTVVSLLFTFLLTRYRIYKLHPLSVGLTASLILFAASLSAAAMSPPLSSAGVFSLAISVLMVTYAAFPLPLYICVMSGLFYSLMFELIVLTVGNWSMDSSFFAVRLLLHVAVHLLGMHLFIMTQVRLRSTFLKVGQSALVRRDLEVEKALKDKMIASVMPPKVSAWLLAEGPAEDEEIEQADGTIRKLSSPRASNAASTAHSTTNATTTNFQGSLFRPFNMNKMDNVSILFADIVGFTRMSSNKSAEQLVGLLNDLFGRFDALCTHLGCEKISTLGDCYYCVSGCPEPRLDHARCCVRMGLSMIDAVHRFGMDHEDDFQGSGERVNMRVGVHTGTVLCGVVGTKRFKFDVWSNDVTTANRMESTGKAGRVHISQQTYSYLHDEFYIEEGEPHNDMKTYFIIGAKNVLDGLATADSCPSWTHQDSLGVDTTPEQQGERNSEDETLALPPIIVNEENETASTVIEGQMPKKNSLTQSWSTLNSRKDSGIRSRRSSIQAQLMENGGLATTDLLMINGQDDDFYASSQYSVVDDGILSQENKNRKLLHHPSASSENYFDLNIPLNESLTRFHLLRKQSDIQMIKCIQRNSTHADYFMRPPVNPFTLFFVDSEIELEYRQRAHRQEEGENFTAPLTLSSPTFNTYFDILIAAVIYVIVTFSCFLLFDTNTVSIVFCCLATSWLLFVVALCIRRLLLSRFASTCLQKLYDTFTLWYPWHICGAVLITLPVVSVTTSSTCNLWLSSTDSAFFCCIFFVAVIHFCNFTQLNCWMKSGLATLSGGVLLLLLCVDVCYDVEDLINIHNSTGALYDDINWWNSTENVTKHMNGDKDNKDEVGEHGEATMAVLLLLLLVWYINREYEISYRISFHGNLLAERDQQTIQLEKDQADWLLHNIIPRHVAEHIKITSKYSENHENVGVLFASIINFNEMYDESYRGGCECLRVLNEVIGDFDELLHRPEFKNVEKIKTIGTTFMAASGLNPKIRQQNVHPYQHLFELMDFALALERVIDAFNADLLEFSFIIRIGFNFGDVTAGVIGTTKLYYDIWSDDVNIASRMDSTGVPGRIQVPKKCVEILQEVFEFEHRGTIFVKGKDNMDVYLLVRKKEDVDYRSPRGLDANVVVSPAAINH